MCEIEQGKHDQQGELVEYPVVWCSPVVEDVIVLGTMHFLSDNPPSWCPYVVEHVVAVGHVDTSEDDFWGPKNDKRSGR